MKLYTTLQKNKKSHGFTVLEVVIVMAIAALIITGVLIATATASKSSRDARRRADTQALASAIDQWTSNHSGILPTIGTTGSEDIGVSGFGTITASSPFFSQNYIDLNKFKDPSTRNYYILGIPADKTVLPTCGSLGAAAVIWYYRLDNRAYRLYTCLESGMYTYDPS